MGARETALHALMACRKDGAWVNAAVKEYVRRDRLDSRDAALAARLCYGVVQNRLKLDFYLRQLLTGRLSALHPVVRDVLHLGLYQLLEMTKIPESAAVNESVALTKKYCPKQKNAPALVNAVLRAAARSREQLAQPQTLAEKYSHPENLLALLGSYVGQQRLEPMLMANNAAPDTVVQVNTLKTDAQTLAATLEAQGIGVRPHSWLPECLVLTSTGDLEGLDAFRNGLFYVQDPAARLSVLCAGLAGQDWKILDCCAAPGGKSFAAAMDMGGRGSILACDIHPHRVQLLEKGASRLGMDNITARCQDATQCVEQWVGQLDAVIVDVPCSGYGIIRKKPDIRYKDPDSMRQLPELQLRILQNQARYVRPGGTLVYATCTLVRRENQGVVEKFLKSNPEFTTVGLELPGNFPQNESGMLTLVPGEYDTDGFFICRLERKS